MWASCFIFLKQYSVFVNLSLNVFLVHTVCLLVDWKDFKLFTGELAVGSSPVLGLLEVSNPKPQNPTFNWVLDVLIVPLCQSKNKGHLSTGMPKSQALPEQILVFVHHNPQSK